MKKMYRGWFISRDPLDKYKCNAVKGKEKIIGTENDVLREIDQRAFEELKELVRGGKQ